VKTETLNSLHCFNVSYDKLVDYGFLHYSYMYCLSNQSSDEILSYIIF